MSKKNTPTNNFEEVDYGYLITQIDIDEEFEFSCHKCGNCCTERDDVILSPHDIYKASKELKITPFEFTEKYCAAFISPTTKLLRIYINSQLDSKDCPFLSDKQICKLSKSKPASCALFPIGRFLISPDEANPEIKEISYVLTHTNCGMSHTYTVREWLETADIPADDPTFIAWFKTTTVLSEILKTYEKELKQNNIWELFMQTFLSIYVQYDTDKEFMPQFLIHSTKLLKLAHDIQAYLLEQNR